MGGSFPEQQQNRRLAEALDASADAPVSRARPPPAASAATAPRPHAERPICKTHMQTTVAARGGLGRLGSSPVRQLARQSVKRTCAICERTLLIGERAVRFAPGGDEFVDVCPLCQETAVERGWVKEGSPTTPTVPNEQRRRRRRGLGSLFDMRRPSQAEPVVSEPILRRLSEPELEMVEAADMFNSSDHRRTVGGIAKSLGAPRVSILPLSGVTGELIVTVAWDISWYQYRVTPESAQPVRLADRGQELSDLETTFKRWNARVDRDGRLVPNISRV
jgi:hypothetical protein